MSVPTLDKRVEAMKALMKDAEDIISYIDVSEPVVRTAEGRIACAQTRATALVAKGLGIIAMEISDLP